MITIFNGRKLSLDEAEEVIYVNMAVALREYLHLFNNGRNLNPWGVFTAISLHTDQWGWCWLGRDRLKNETGIGTENAISSALTHLRKMRIEGKRVLAMYRERDPESNQWKGTAYRIFPDAWTTEESHPLEHAPTHLRDLILFDPGTTNKKKDPHTDDRDVDEPHTDDPYMDKPDTDNPYMGEPDTDNPYMDDPHMGNQYVGEPDMGKPYMGNQQHKENHPEKENHLDKENQKEEDCAAERGAPPRPPGDADAEDAASEDRRKLSLAAGLGVTPESQQVADPTATGGMRPTSTAPPGWLPAWEAALSGRRWRYDVSLPEVAAFVERFADPQHADLRVPTDSGSIRDWAGGAETALNYFTSPANGHGPDIRLRLALWSLDWYFAAKARGRDDLQHSVTRTGSILKTFLLAEQALRRAQHEQGLQPWEAPAMSEQLFEEVDHANDDPAISQAAAHADAIRRRPRRS